MRRNLDFALTLGARARRYFSGSEWLLLLLLLWFENLSAQSKKTGDTPTSTATPGHFCTELKAIGLPRQQRSFSSRVLFALLDSLCPPAHHLLAPLSSTTPTRTCVQRAKPALGISLNKYLCPFTHLYPPSSPPLDTHHGLYRSAATSGLPTQHHPRLDALDHLQLQQREPR